MEKTIRRVVIATVLGMLLLTGCGSRTSNTEKAVGESQILFENQLEKEVYGVTIRRGEGWVPPVNGEEIIPAGATFTVELSALSDGPGRYEILCFGMDNWYYSVRNVPLEGGTRIALTSEGHTACITVTASDGSTRSVEGEACEVEE